MPDSQNIEQTVQEAKNLLTNDGVFAVFELLARKDATEAACAFKQLQSFAYWQRKNLREVVPISLAGIQHALGHGLESDAKAIAYDLASFAWPGWDEKGIEITPADIAIGNQAVAFNLHLARKLNKPAKAQANALWMVGAYHLATRDFEKAAGTFADAIPFAKETGESPLVHMLMGYQHLAKVLAFPGDSSHPNAFQSEQTALRTLGGDDAAFFADQLGSVLQFFRNY